MSFDKRRSIRLLKLFCPGRLQESVIGDLEEQYEINRTSKSKLLSDLLLTYNVLRFLRPGILKHNNHSSNMTSIKLLQNFFRVFIRSAKRNIGFYSLNLVGMTLGLSVTLFVLLYVFNETSYDQFHPQSENIYRVTAKRTYGPLFPHITVNNSNRIIDGDYSWTDKATQFSRVAESYVRVEGKRFSENQVLVTSSGDRFFDVFGFELKYGNRKSVTAQTNSVILSASHASKYFGNENPVGQSIYFDSLLMNVSGVFEDLPTNTHLVCDMLLVSDAHFATKNSALVYFILNENVDTGRVENEILKDAQKDEKNRIAEVGLQNIKDIHLGPNFTFDLSKGGSKEQIGMYSAIAIIILLISCTNFTNLSTGIFARRKKEMAVRKVLGSSRSGLTTQFLFESLCLALLSLPFVYSINSIALPFFNSFTGIQFMTDQLFDLQLVGIILTIAMASGLLSGIYPSLVMTRISILNLFKTEFKVSGNKIPLRKVLITLQFCFLIVLGSGAFLVNQQLSFLSEKNTGINKEGVLKLKRVWSLDGVERIKAFKSRLLSQSYVLSVSQGYAPGDEDYPMTYQPEGFDATFDDALRLSTDLDYFEVLGIEERTGPFFKEDNHPETSLLVNETLAKNLKWDDPIGKKITINPGSGRAKDYAVRGVYADFNFFSLHEEIQPQMIFMRENREYVSQNILVKINLSHTKEAFEWIEKVWDEFLPHKPLNYVFLDEDIQRAYESDKQTATISTILTVIAILLSVLGLIGVTAFITSTRTKEMGIRKVLGASVSSLLFHFNKEYVPLILLATIISSACSYFIFADWLNNFAYHITINPLIFPLAGILVLLISFSTVSLLSLGVVKENPIKALRSD